MVAEGWRRAVVTRVILVVVVDRSIMTATLMALKFTGFLLFTPRSILNLQIDQHKPGFLRLSPQGVWLAFEIIIQSHN